MGNVRIHAPGGGEKPFVAGSYKGDGQRYKDISLQFQPSVVMLWRRDGAQASFIGGTFKYYGGMAMPGLHSNADGSADATYAAISVTPDGFRVQYYSDWQIYTNYSDTEYYYIAFR